MIKYSLIAALCFLLANGSWAQTPSAETQSELYRATIAAAEKSLRLNEVSQAKRWLSKSPKSQRKWEWKFLSAQTNESDLQARFDDDLPTALSASPDGRHLATATSDGEIQIRESDDLKVLRTIAAHESTIYSVTFDSTGKRLTSVSRDVSAKVFDTSSGQLVSMIKLNNPGVAATTFSPDGSLVATCSWSIEGKPRSVKGMVWIWDSKTGKILHRKPVGIKPLDSISWKKTTSNDIEIVVGSWDGLVHCLDAKANEIKRITMPDEGLYNAVMTVDISPDGQRIAAGSKDRTVRIWNIENEKLVRTLRDHTGHVNDVKYSNDGRWITTGCEDSVIRLWSTNSSLATPIKMRGHTRGVGEIGFSPSNGMIFSISSDQSLRRWDRMHPFGGTRLIETGEEGTYATQLMPDDKTLYVATHRGAVVTFDIENGKKAKEFIAHDGSTCNTLSLDEKGTKLLTCSWDKTVKLWSVPEHKLLHTFELETGVYHCKLTPSGKHALATAGNKVVVWDTETRQKVQELNGLPKSVRSIAVSKDSRWCAAIGDSGSIGIWSLDDPKLTRIIRNAVPGGSQSILFSKDSNSIYCGDNQGNFYVFNLRHAKLESKITVSNRPIYRIAESSSADRIAVGSLGVALVNKNDPEPLLNFFPVADSVWDLVYSRDGKTIVLCNTAGTVAICKVP